MIAEGDPIEGMTFPARVRLRKYGSTLDANNVRHVIERIEDYPEIIEAVHQLDAKRRRESNV